MCAPRVFNANTQRLCCTASVTSRASSWNARCGAWVLVASGFRPRLRYRMFCSVCSHVRPRTLDPPPFGGTHFIFAQRQNYRDPIPSFHTSLITDYFQIKLLAIEHDVPFGNVPTNTDSDVRHWPVNSQKGINLMERVDVLVMSLLTRATWNLLLFLRRTLEYNRKFCQEVNSFQYDRYR